jgi:N-acetylglucosamine-6-phosphate deacetylase
MQADVVVDCKGMQIAPGYIDLQVNGAFGIDFSALHRDHPDDMVEQLHEAARGFLKFGVTSFCPTIVTSAPDTYAKLVPSFARFQGSAKAGATNLGLHLEGYFN